MNPKTFVDTTGVYIFCIQECTFFFCSGHRRCDGAGGRTSGRLAGAVGGRRGRSRRRGRPGNGHVAPLLRRELDIGFPLPEVASNPDLANFSEAEEVFLQGRFGFT